MLTGRLELPQLSPHAPQACVSTTPPRQQINSSTFNLRFRWRGGATAIAYALSSKDTQSFSSAEYHVSKTIVQFLKRQKLITFAVFATSFCFNFAHQAKSG